MKTRGPAKKELKRATGFSLDPSLVTELRQIARRLDRSLSYVASEAIAEYVWRRKASV